VIRVILADDNIPFRSTLRTLIERRYPARVVAEVENGLDGIRAAEQERPDLVILDISMAVMNGFGAAQDITARYPGVQLIMMSGNMDASSREEAFRCGAHSCVAKLTFTKELIPAIQRALAGAPGLG